MTYKLGKPIGQGLWNRTTNRLKKQLGNTLRGRLDGGVVDILGGSVWNNLFTRLADLWRVLDDARTWTW